jgi:electron transfer flavoprotein beta subunit
VPDTSEAEVVPDSSVKDIRRERLAFTINEADKYALEEAVRIKERTGATVTLVSIGPKENDDVLRMGMAMGADKSVRLHDEAFAGSDALGLARILARAIVPLKPDLVLCGAQASDDGQAMVGPMLAELLGFPHASYVTKVTISGTQMDADAKETQGTTLVVNRELEGGLLEKDELPMPALLTIQTGINMPRYASLMGIKRAQAKELKVFSAPEAGITVSDVGASGARSALERLYVPKVEVHAEIIQGNENEASAKLAAVLRERGLL